ncbi:MAG: AarF/ABC1/UbiB kinase family protein [Candidatus Eremiobacteraeota bacterium]|nr:AarF/ABC1/UbiB kinase family protein [Candidatus Eremiobacteraeota bacterium]
MSIYAVYGKLKRYKQIVEVLSRHQYGFLVDYLGIYRFIPHRWRRKKDRGGEVEAITKWDRARMVLEDLGGAFIKMGQMLSTRGDLLPRELIDELEKLQDQVPPFPYEEVRRIVEKELNARLEDVFLEFEAVPLASASIGQVHRARLKHGEDVIVKVMRPEIKTQVKIDSEILIDAARFLERRRLFRGRYNFTGIASEISDYLEQETDYLHEVHNAERFRKNLAEDSGVYVPKVYWGYTTSRILCMERIQGTKISEVDTLTARGVNCREIARVGIGSYFKQILVHGFFHADPHPGNVFVTNDSKIIFVDFGLVGELDVGLRNKLGDLFLAVVRRNMDGIIDALLAVGSIPPQIDRIRFKRELSFLYEKYSTLPLKQINIGEVFKEVMGLMYRHQVKIPPDLTLMIKTITSLEGMGRRLDPDFNILEPAEPFARELVRERIMSHWWFSDTIKQAQDMVESFGTLVKQLSSAFSVMERGELRIRHEHQGFPRLINRLCFALLVASMVIGSSWIFASRSGYTYVGLIGVLLSFLMAMWLLISIARGGKF